MIPDENTDYSLKETIEEVFSYHAPKGDQVERYAKIRDKAKEFANLIDELCPFSEEKGYALHYIHLANMLANASIAVNE